MTDWQARAQSAEAKLSEAVRALERIVDESVFNQQRFAEDDDTDYFLRCFKAIKDRARSTLATIQGGGLGPSRVTDLGEEARQSNSTTDGEGA